MAYRANGTIGNGHRAIEPPWIFIIICAKMKVKAVLL